MTYTDYYDSEKFHEAFKYVDFLNKTEIDPFYNLDHNVRNSSYKIDRKGYLYFILGKYTTNLFKLKNDYLDSHAYILDYSIIGDKKGLFTSLGNVSFSLCVNSVKEAYIMSDDKKTIDVLCRVYSGKYANRCHEVSSILGINYEYITTAFVNSPLRHYKYLHSFVEDGDYVYDFARNLKIKKEDYYQLLEPEVVSKINGNYFIDDLRYASVNYPEMSLKEFLIKHDDFSLKR